MSSVSQLDVSFVIPCLNEERGVVACIRKIRSAMEKEPYSYEIVVSDNGSTDKTVEVASQVGARVVHQPMRGYGAAYLKGFSEAFGRWIIMGDGDDTYDFSQIGLFLRELEKGSELVIGSRFRGEILPGAMPWLHLYVGNPILSGLLNRLFGISISDSHCGLRALTKDAYQRMNLVTTGMEFASEMVIKASFANLRVTEVPITYHPRLGDSKLRSFRDGWRHLRFMLLYSPGFLFLVPGGLLSLLGWILLFGLLFGPVQIGGRMLDFHFMFLGSLLVLLGSQFIGMGILGKVFAHREGLDPRPQPTILWLEKNLDVNFGLYISAVFLFIGGLIFLAIFLTWTARSFGDLQAIRPAILGLTFVFLGLQIGFSSFLWGLFQIQRFPPK